jgi:dTDP-4-dehydrorhamnose 3,5-epimerase
MPTIQDLKVTPLRIIEDDRGSVMHMLRLDDPHFEKFGEIYFSTTRPNMIKAWKRHKRMILNVTAPVGKIRLVVYDARTESASYKKVDEFILGPSDRYELITIPPMTWFGFQNIGQTDALLANCATIPHEPDEAEQRELNDVPVKFDWSIK